MCYKCNRFATGYRGQAYEVYFTRDGEEHRMGWQNQPSGGLEDAAKLMPGVTSTRVAPVSEEQKAEYENRHKVPHN